LIGKFLTALSAACYLQVLKGNHEASRHQSKVALATSLTSIAMIAW
jgi:hypothetical protein